MAPWGHDVWYAIRRMRRAPGFTAAAIVTLALGLGLNSAMHVATRDATFDVTGSVVTANYFGVLRLRPAIGRFFTADEESVPERNPTLTLLAGPAALSAVAVLAIWLPARRALAVDPMVTLRVE